MKIASLYRENIWNTSNTNSKQLNNIFLKNYKRPTGLYGHLSTIADITKIEMSESLLFELKASL